MATVTPASSNEIADRLTALRLTSDARARALRVPLWSNFALVLLKLLTWAASGSVSILSEAFHSAADLIVTSFQLVFVRMAARPADEDHAYGHGKYENVSAAIEALIILTTAGFVISQALQHLAVPRPLTHIDAGIALMFLSAAVNVVVSRRLDTVARDEQSPALSAEAAQLRADVFTAGGVGLGLIAIRVTGISLIDPILSLVVAGLIIKAALDVTARAIVDLTDGRLPPQQEQLIRSLIERHAAVFSGYHKLRTRRSGGGEFIDFHLKMNGEIALRQAHDMSDAIVVDIKRAMPRAHVLIHLEPDR